MRKPQSDAIALVIIFVTLALLGIAYLAYLDHGCPLTGIMTWHGKICI